jgi:hypothetical protein
MVVIFLIVRPREPNFNHEHEHEHGPFSPARLAFHRWESMAQSDCGLSGALPTPNAP